MNNALASTEPIQPVTVRRHRIHWEASDLDLAEVTAQRAMTLGPELHQGCWYLNPRFTVSSPAPTAAFFRTVLQHRSSWLRTCRQVLGNYGQRRLARQIARGSRLAAIPEDNQSGEAPSATHPLPDPSYLSERTASQHREVIQAGQTAKNLAFSGVLFIDGVQIPPRTWQAMADEGKEPTPRS